MPCGSQNTPAQAAFGLPGGMDFRSDWNTWLNVQNGVNQPNPPVAPVTPHYFSKGRDMAQYVHTDELFQANLSACLILITPTKRGAFGTLIDQGNPYVGGS